MTTKPKRSGRVQSDINKLFHPDDIATLQAFRRELVGWHYTSNRAGATLGKSIGRGESFITSMERGNFAGPLSSLYDWAQIFDLRIGYTLYGLPEAFAVPDESEVEAMALMERMYPSFQWHWRHLAARLKATREARFSTAEVAARLGVKTPSLRLWEDGSRDPLIPKLFSYVRTGLGGGLLLSLTPMAHDTQ